MAGNGYSAREKAARICQFEFYLLVGENEGRLPIAMHELTRRTYLEAMGIDSYISRSEMPGAAPTHRLVINRRSAVPDVSSSLQPATTTTPAASNTAMAFREAANTVRARLGANEATSSTVAVAPAVSQSSAEAVPRFSIVAVIAGGFLWLEELSDPSVSRDQVHLIRAMAKALGPSASELEVSQFDWPIHSNAQLDLGENAARACLGSFVQRKADQGKCRGLILLGDGCGEKLDKTQIESTKCVSTVGTREMLRDPQLKKQAWRDLLPIANSP